MKSEQIMENLLAILPYWHCKIDRPFKQSLKEKMSLEAYYCLQTLRQDGPMAMTELAARLRMTKQQATKLVEKLHGPGMVRRVYGEEDRRFITIEITELANHYIEQDYYKNSVFLQQLEEKIGPEELEEFGVAITALLKILPKVD